MLLLLLFLFLFCRRHHRPRRPHRRHRCRSLTLSSYSVTYYCEICSEIYNLLVVQSNSKRFFFNSTNTSALKHRRVNNSHYDKCNVIRNYCIVKMECQLALFFKTQFYYLLCRIILVHWWLCVPNVWLWHSGVFDTVIHTAG